MPGIIREVLRELGLPDRQIICEPRKDVATGAATAIAAHEGVQEMIGVELMDLGTITQRLYERVRKEVPEIKRGRRIYREDAEVQETLQRWLQQIFDSY